MGSFQTPLYILIGVLLAFGINIGLGYLLGTDLPIVAVESNSMVPTFYKGDILIIQKIPAKDLRLGDIIVFSVPQQKTPIVHRIIKMHPDGAFQTKGDNIETNKESLNFEKDIKPEQIHGKEILIIPYLGWVKITIVDYIMPNIIVLIVLGSIFVFIYFITINRRRK